MGVRSGKLRGFAVCALVVACLGAAVSALAADPPKWVAAVFMDAQRSVGLRWQPAAGATGYKVLRSVTKGSGYVEVAAPKTPQYFDATVEPGTAYYYVLQAIDAAGASANSDERSVTIPGQKKVVLEPPMWKALQVTSTTEFGKTSFKVALQWTRNAVVVAYNVYRSEAAGKDYQLVGSVSEDQYVDTAVQEGKTYYYVLTGLDNSFQESKYSEEKSAFLEAKKKEAKKEVMANPKIVMKGSKEVLKIRTGEGFEFRGSSDLAIDSDGNIYSPGKDGKVLVFDAQGNFLRAFGEQGTAEGKIQYPIGIDIDSEDNVYIADRTEPARIVVYNQKGAFKRQIVVDPPDEEYLKQFSRPVKPLIMDVAVAKNGRIFAADNVTQRIVMLEPDGKYIKFLGGPGTESGKLTFPGWVKINPAGTELHVCNGLNRRIEVFDLEGAYLRTYGISKSFIGSFIGPTGITFDEQGNSVICDAAMATMQVFSPAGEYLYHVGLEKPELDAENKQRPIPFSGSLAGVTYHPGLKALLFVGKDTAGPYLGGRVVLDK